MAILLFLFGFLCHYQRAHKCSPMSLERRKFDKAKLEKHSLGSDVELTKRHADIPGQNKRKCQWESLMLLIRHPNH
ncbi:unnamed protein product [Taenia asiatica]|uniref:Secreted protein n=1 Tax=Taenia asiatica TaxID=60517 RepID=A0A0R3WAY7_TAEAS|nr:unnamed protein product [Taenia asiatica]